MQLSPDDKLMCVGCEIIHREACRLAADSPYQIDLQFLPKGLHDLETADMRSRLQQAIDSVPDTKDYKAIILGYARCNDGVTEVYARSIPLIIPRAHDCITFFFGSRSAYQDYFDAHPGTYFMTTGWYERNNAEVEGTQGVMAKLGLTESYEQMVEKYGRENADFIVSTMGDGLQNYSRYCYIRMGVGPEDQFIEDTRRKAQERGWEFECRSGDWSLLERLFRGQWDGEDIIIVPPHHKLVAHNDHQVLGVVPA